MIDEDGVCQRLKGIAEISDDLKFARSDGLNGAVGGGLILLIRFGLDSGELARLRDLLFLKLLSRSNRFGCVTSSTGQGNGHGRQDVSDPAFCLIIGVGRISTSDSGHRYGSGF